jgi:putative ABC transport system substrate-binding protein
MNRREFMLLVGGAAVWPLAARAQQREPMRRIGVLINQSADDPASQLRLTAFAQGLQESGWVVGGNLRIDYRWGAGDADRIRKNAAEILSIHPEVILAAGTLSVAALRQDTRATPIVFVNVTDPVGNGLVASLARPGGHMTGFMQFEFSLSGKWLELLKQIAPGMTRVAVLRDQTNPSGIAQFAAIQAMAPSLGVEAIPVGIHDEAEISRAIAEFARLPNGGLIVSASGPAILRRELIITMAQQRRLPAIYPYDVFVADGGLLSYGPDLIDEYRLAAGYVARILKNEKPADLPVQAPTKYALAINLKTAKAQGIEIPPLLLTRADEVIE